MQDDPNDGGYTYTSVAVWVVITWTSWNIINSMLLVEEKVGDHTKNKNTLSVVAWGVETTDKTLVSAISHELWEEAGLTNVDDLIQDTKITLIFTLGDNDHNEKIIHYTRLFYISLPETQRKKVITESNRYQKWEYEVLRLAPLPGEDEVRQVRQLSLSSFLWLAKNESNRLRPWVIEAMTAILEMLQTGIDSSWTHAMIPIKLRNYGGDSWVGYRDHTSTLVALTMLDAVIWWKITQKA